MIDLSWWQGFYNQGAITMTDNTIQKINVTFNPSIASIDPAECCHADLPFVRKRGKNKPHCYWNVTPNGNLRDEMLIGNAYAVELLQYDLMTPGSQLLPAVVSHMPREGNRTGIEIGFLGAIEYYAVQGAKLLSQ